MPAFVGADAAKTLRVLEPFDMLLNRAAGNVCRGDHFRKGDLRIAADQVQEHVGGFLTTFSYHLFLTTLRLASRLQRPKDHVEHEVDEDAGVARLLGGMKRLVVSALVAKHHVLYRQGVEERIPTAEYHSLPKAPHPSVAVGERMDRLEDEMEDAALHQRDVLRALQPAEEVLHQKRNLVPRRRVMHCLATGVEDPDVALAPLAGVLDQILRHQRMRPQQRAGRQRIERLDL